MNLDRLAGLGPLERRVMDAVWRSGEASVRDVHATLGELAYTTLMTTLERLHRKGLLDRRKTGKAFLYRARRTAAELRQDAARGLLASLLSVDGDEARPILSCIVEAVGARDRAMLDDLSRLVRRKRREREEGGR
jgi:predicted transcriptional regulator